MFIWLKSFNASTAVSDTLTKNEFQPPDSIIFQIPYFLTYWQTLRLRAAYIHSASIQVILFSGAGNPVWDSHNRTISELAGAGDARAHPPFTPSCSIPRTAAVNSPIQSAGVGSMFMGNLGSPDPAAGWPDVLRISCW